MTRDEILKMEAGEEIDTLVAEKVMGWHVETDERGKKSWRDFENRYQHLVSQYEGYEDGEDFNLIYWHPSESILWAQEVLEKIKDDVFGIFWENAPGAKEWTVVLKPEDSYSGGFPVDGETLELAICRAAVLLKALDA